VIAVIQEAKVAQFDLDTAGVADLTLAQVPPAVIAAMRQRSQIAANAAPAAGSFAEVAAAAAAQRALTPKSTVVITSADVPEGRVDAVAPIPPAATSASKSEPAVPGTAAANDEAYWRGRVAPYITRIADNSEKSLALRRRIDELTVELLNIGPLNTRRGGVETERQRLITECQALDDAIVADTKGLEAVKDEGRRAGALPGWFRD
jgi:hypothetical protein